MAEDSVGPSLAPATDDERVLRLAQAAITRFHAATMGDARIAFFFAEQKPAGWWGSVKIVTEEGWWLHGYDITVQINRAVWNELTDAAALGLLDHFLSTVQAKTGGQTQMQTKRGTRTLYERLTPSLSIHPQVIARNPDFVKEMEELRRLHKALDEPKQFLLEFAQEQAAAARTGGEPELEDEGEGGDGEEESEAGDAPALAATGATTTH